MRPVAQIDATSPEPSPATPAQASSTPPLPLEGFSRVLLPAETPPPLPTTSEYAVGSPSESKRLVRLAPGLVSKLNLVVDLGLVAASLLICTSVMGHDLDLERTDISVLLGVGLVAWVFLGTALCLYDARFADREPLDDVALQAIQVMGVTVALLLTRLVMGSESWIIALSMFPPLVLPSVVLLRLYVFRRLSVKEEPLDEVLILGVGTMGRMTGEDLGARHRRKVIGYLGFSNEPATEAPNAPVLGLVKELEHVLCTVPVDEVYIAGNVLKHSAEMQAAIKVCENLGVPFALPAYHFRFDRARPIGDPSLSDGYLHFLTHAFQPHQMALKRMFDIVSSAAALVVLSPLLLGVALGVKLTSRGPIFFKQKRVGLHGKPFYMLKFRSMVVNAEELKAKLEALNEQTGPVFKMKNDPRITRIGRFIRKYSIDELPQLLNVLRGEMSVVGPRPPIPSEVEKYAAWQRRRLSVRPGLTCIWQVSGRNQISFEQWMYLDMQYIDHWSLKKDIDLILKTVPVVITGSGAS